MFVVILEITSLKAWHQKVFDKRSALNPPFLSISFYQTPLKLSFHQPPSESTYAFDSSSAPPTFQLLTRDLQIGRDKRFLGPSLDPGPSSSSSDWHRRWPFSSELTWAVDGCLTPSLGSSHSRAVCFVTGSYHAKQTQVHSSLELEKQESLGR